MSVKAVLLDLDGTLVKNKIDFVEMKKRLIAYFQAHGAKGSFSLQETNSDIIEHGMRLISSTESERNGTQIKDELNTIMNSIELKALEKIEIINGSKRALAQLRKKGIKIGILSRGCREYVEGVLHATRLEEFVDGIATRDDVSKPKPDPQQLFYLVRELKVKPEEAVVVGDHAVDYECAKNAGVRFVGVLTGFSDADTFKRAGCLQIIDSVEGLPDVL